MPGAVQKYRKKLGLYAPSKASGSATGAGLGAGYKNNPTGELATSFRGQRPQYLPEDQPGRVINARKPLVLDQPAPYLAAYNEYGPGGIGKIGRSPSVGNVVPTPGKNPANRLKEGAVIVKQGPADPAQPADSAVKAGAQRIKEADRPPVKSMPSAPPNVQSTTDPKVPRRKVFG